MEAESTKGVYSLAGIGGPAGAEDGGSTPPALLDPTTLNGIELIL